MFPNPLYVLLKGGAYLTLEDVFAETREDILNTDQTNYRDTMDAAFQGGFTTTTAAGIQQGGNQAPVSATLTKETDEYTHTVPRNTFSKRTMIRWWQSGGASLIFSADLTVGSAVAVVKSLNRLYEGMALSGTGITAGTIIQELRTVPTISAAYAYPVYNVILSQVAGAAAAAGAAITATSPYGDLAGECWADRFIGWSAEPPMR